MPKPERKLTEDQAAYARVTTTMRNSLPTISKMAREWKVDRRVVWSAAYGFTYKVKK